MARFTVKWIVDGEMVVEAEDKEAAETVVQQILVAILTDVSKWPLELGAKGIQGAATAEGQAAD